MGALFQEFKVLAHRRTALIELLYLGLWDLRDPRVEIDSIRTSFQRFHEWSSIGSRTRAGIAAYSFNVNFFVEKIRESHEFRACPSIRLNIPYQ